MDGHGVEVGGSVGGSVAGSGWLSGWKSLGVFLSRLSMCSDFETRALLNRIRTETELVKGGIKRQRAAPADDQRGSRLLAIARI